MSVLDRISAPKSETQTRVEAEAEARRELARNKAGEVAKQLAAVATQEGVVAPEASQAAHEITREIPVVNANTQPQNIDVQQNSGQ